MSLLLALTGGAAPTTITISDNTGATYAGVSDTMIKSLSPTTNYGTNTIFEGTNWDSTDVAHGLIKFDGLSSVGAGTVTNAKLRLWVNAFFSTPTTQVFAMLRDFVEAQATWNQYSTGNNWGTSGANNTTTDYSNSLLSSLAITVTAQYVEFTGAALTAYVDAIVNGGSHFGLQIRDSSEPASPLNRGVQYVTSEGLDGRRPELVFDWVAAGGSNVTINAGVGALSLTGLSASVNNTREVAATLGALSLTGLSATISTATTINAGVGGLSLTGLSANIDKVINVSAGVGQLNLTGLAATVDRQTTIAAGIGALSLTGLAAVVNNTKNIAASVGELSLTGLSASVSNAGSTNIGAGVGELSLTGLQASINNVNNIVGTLGQLNLTGLAANVNNTRNIIATLGALSLTGLQATVSNTYAVSATAGQLNLTGLNATVTNTPSGVTINAGVGELSLTGLSAIITNGGQQVGGGGHVPYIGRRPRRVIREHDELEEVELNERDAEIKALLEVVKSKKTRKSRQAEAKLSLPMLELPLIETISTKKAKKTKKIDVSPLISDDEIELLLALMMEM